MNIRMALKKLMRQNYLKNYYSSLRDKHVSDENSAHANENNRRLLSLIFKNRCFVVTWSIFEEFKKLC